MSKICCYLANKERRDSAGKEREQVQRCGGEKAWRG